MLILNITLILILTINLIHPDTDSEIDTHSNSNHKPDLDPNHEINCFPEPYPNLDPKCNHNPDTNSIPKPNPNADFVKKCSILTLFLHILFIIIFLLFSHKKLLLRIICYFDVIFTKFVFTNTAEFHLNLLQFNNEKLFCRRVCDSGYIFTYTA